MRPSAEESVVGRLRLQLDMMRRALAALSHEINQPLAATAAYLDAARRMVMKPEADREEIARILGKGAAQAQRASRLVANLHGLLQPGEPDKTLGSLHSLIRESLDLLRAEGALDQLKAKVELGARCDSIIADQAQLKLVLCNALRVASDAMLSANRRELAILSTNPDSETIRIDLVDTGLGAPDEVTHEPFTMKKANRMALGLLLSQPIIEEHDGTLLSAPDREAGLLFSMTLPLRDLEVAS